jgi:beta-glucanase (GH16 family)
MKKNQLPIVFLLTFLFATSCNSKDEPIYVGERIANIIAESSNPAKDGTPTLESLAAAGIKEATQSQIAYEEAFANALPIPTTLTEMQEIVDLVNAGYNNLGNNNVLVWADEFDTDGSPSSSKWTYDIGVGSGGWGNNESQFYTNRADNVKIENGLLKITAKKESFSGSSYTSTRLKTQGKYSFTYGKVEVRAKLPQSAGTWPAIWMLGNNITTVGWPSCGEIDIMEQTGANKLKTSCALHTPSSFGNTVNVAEKSVVTATSEFHVYGVNWTPEKMDFSIDGVVFYTYNPSSKDANNWPFTADQFLILNVAMGGTLGGTIPSNFTESTMEIDYVRVYQ